MPSFDASVKYASVQRNGSSCRSSSYESCVEIKQTAKTLVFKMRKKSAHRFSVVDCPDRCRKFLPRILVVRLCLKKR